MDKYEYRIRAEEINDLIEKKEYVQAVKIADTIDWRRVRSVVMLCKISELYKINRRYEDSKEVLLLAYELQGNSRKIIYSLCELSIKLDETVQAVEYYKEFIKVAPRDTGRFILQYRIYTAQDVSLEERIAVLEEYQRREYREKWMYELAYLYHRIGLATRCIEECDDIFVWFGEGKYVIKALELKMLHAPLSPEQQEVYNARFMIPEPEITSQQVEEETKEAEVEPSLSIEIKSVEVTRAKTAEIPSKEVNEEIEEAIEEENPEDVAKTQEVVYPEEDLPQEVYEYSQEELQQVQEDVQEEEIPDETPEESDMKIADASDDMDIQVKTIDVNDEYNTINLQDELAKNLAEMFAQEDMEAADATRALPIDSIFEATKEIPEKAEEVQEIEEIEETPEVEEAEEIEEAPEAEEVEEIEEAPEAEEAEEIEEAPEAEEVEEIEEAPEAEEAEEIEEVPEVEEVEEIEEVPEAEEVEEIEEVPEVEEVEEIEEVPEVEEVEEIEEVPEAEEVEEIEEIPEVEEVEEIEEVPEAKEVDEIREIPVVEEVQEVEEVEEIEEVAEEFSKEEEPKEIPAQIPAVEPLIFSQNQPLPEAFIQAVQSAAIEAAKQAAKQAATEAAAEAAKQAAQATAEAIKEMKPEVAVEEEVIAEPVEETPEEPEVEEAVDTQITGQLSFSDIMAEWEETKKANEEKHLQEMKQRVMEQTGPLLTDFDINTRNSIQSDLDMLSPMLEVFPESDQKEVEAEISPIPDFEDEKEPETIDQVEEELVSEVEEALKEEETVETEEIAEMVETVVEAEEAHEPELQDRPSSFNTEEINGLEDKLMGALSKQHYDTANLQASVMESEMAKANNPVSAAVAETVAATVAAMKAKSITAESVVTPVAAPVIKQEIPIGPRTLTMEEKALFGGIAPNKDLQEKVAEVLDRASLDPNTNNIIISGEKETGTMETAENLVKYLSQTNRGFSGKSKVYSSEDFTGKDIFSIIGEMANGIIVINDAGNMSADLCNKLIKAGNEGEVSGILYILVDTPSGIERLTRTFGRITEYFNLKIDISVLDNDGLVKYGKVYAREKEYSIDDMGVLALYNRIEERQTSEHAVTVQEVKQIIDQAIENSEKKSFSHFMDVLIAKRYDKEDMVILREKDFMFD